MPEVSEGPEIPVVSEGKGMRETSECERTPKVSEINL